MEFWKIIFISFISCYVLHKGKGGGGEKRSQQTEVHLFQNLTLLGFFSTNSHVSIGKQCSIRLWKLPTMKIRIDIFRNDWKVSSPGAKPKTSCLYCQRPTYWATWKHNRTTQVTQTTLWQLYLFCHVDSSTGCTAGIGIPINDGYFDKFIIFNLNIRIYKDTMLIDIFPKGINSYDIFTSQYDYV